MIRQFYDGYGEHFKREDGSEFKYPSPVCIPKKEEEPLCKKSECTNKNNPLSHILSGFKADDLILVGVLLFLIYDGTDDYILLIILGIILLMGFGDKEC